MAALTALVEPSLLAWARKRRNYEPVAAERKIGIPEGRIAEWESGERNPTIYELRKAAKVYKQPLGVFFLSEPPVDWETARDFRRVAGTPAAEWSSDLHAEYDRGHAQRDALLEIAALDAREPESGWQLAGLPDDDLVIAGLALENLQDFAPLAEPTPGADEFKHLNYWVAALEQAGVLVMHTSGGRVSPDEMRAFSLHFDQIPVIVLNGSDWPRARLFSLIHEYAHLLLHTGGLCDTRTDRRTTSEDRLLEARCNAIAAEVLMPASDVLASPFVQSKRVGHEWTLGELIEAARGFGVSVEAFLRRLVTLNRVPPEYYRMFKNQQTEASLKGNKAGKPTFYIAKARDLGKGYVRTVSDAHDRRLIDSTTAAGYLGVKVGQMAELASRARL